MKSYESTITNSSRELTARERIKLKDTTDALSMDEVTNEGRIIIEPDLWAEVSVHNGNAKDGQSTDYTKFIIIDKGGTKYATGSESFWAAFMEMVNEMGDEEFSIEVYKVDSKNYKGKQFITCSIV